MHFYLQEKISLKTQNTLRPLWTFYTHQISIHLSRAVLLPQYGTIYFQEFLRPENWKKRRVFSLKILW
ncbi:ORF178 [White spot syndrome virus]|uniref:Wsv117 n=3 Tax=White spot syndrome virus TaxID=342409 RepID=Q8VB70_WSSVS|nr:wsv117 [Shrimp white spot syndrome virus]AFX59494.1 wsv117 [White spot syndrome virus]AAL33121.1 wsv117 [Shrimp white spot syndrome virus]AAL89041.1 WSSV173 [Shrimp white spot syndrome virus]ATU84048.1 ORF178 [White spot syndrome virus]AWQ60305.1 wsv117 [Shrimp white spot syndrome virus]